MTADVQLAIRLWPNTDVWVSPEDAHLLIQDEFLYGDVFVEKIPDLPDDAQVTHRRVPPHQVRAA